MQLTTPVLRMTRPSATVPPPRQTTFDEQGNAMYELENTIIHSSVTERFKDRGMPVELVSAIGGFLRAFSTPDDHDLFLALANNPEKHDTGHYRIRNLINLSPMTSSGMPMGAFEHEGLRQTLYLLNGLSVWGIVTTRGIVEGKIAEQAKALMYATACVEYDVSSYPITEHYISSRLRRSRFLTDPDFADLLMEFPEHHKLIADTVAKRDSIDVGMLRELIMGSALAISEGTL